MSFTIDLKEKTNAIAKILVIGVGDAGCNVVNRMIEDNVQGVEYVGINTNVMNLANCKAPKTIAIGERVTNGVGAGGDSSVGEKAANENIETIEECLKNADMVFISAGMGGGTGTGAAPVVAEVAKKLGILTVGLVSKPFSFEGNIRKKKADEGIKRMKQSVDSIIILNNDSIFKVAEEDIDAKEAVRKTDEILKKSLAGITEIINRPADLNLDFADLKRVLTNKGEIYIGTGSASGDNKGMEACNKAMNNPLIETSIQKASNIIYFISGKIKTKDFQGVGKKLSEKYGNQANMYFGFDNPENCEDTCNLIVIVTGTKDESKFMVRTK